MDAGSKVEPILNDLKEEIKAIINSAGIRARERLGNNSSTAMSQSDMDTAKKAFSKNIGAIVSSSVMGFIQNKVTTPIVNSGVSKVVDKITEDYQKF